MAKKNPRAEAVAFLEAAADAALRKRLRSLKQKPEEAKPEAEDFSEADLESLAAALEG